MTKIKRFFRSFGHAISGLKKTVMGEQNIKIHIIFGCSALFLSLILRISRLEWLMILIVIFLVVVLEIINTAIEKTVDEISSEKKQVLGDIKDISAGAVLLAAVLSVITGLLIFGPPLIDYLLK